MRTYACVCGNTLFFDNSLCQSCGREVGWCQNCETISAQELQGGTDWVCTTCNTTNHKCENYADWAVCNRMVPAFEDESLCDACRFNDTVPDMSVPGNQEKWARLEAAKRRLFYALDRLGLPYGARDDGIDPPLSFAFMGDPVDQGPWRRMDDAEHVYTGHSNGLITINIKEADDAAREAARVDMNEAHRTLIGHFRHEVGHYYWDLLVKNDPVKSAAFKDTFGDPENPDYATALDRHYQEGPPEDWRETHISAYATMHPWEDWAESFSFYLDMRAVLDTAEQLGLLAPRADAEQENVDLMLARYAQLGLILNELNREMGLLDFMPQVITLPVADKLKAVHAALWDARRGAMAA